MNEIKRRGNLPTPLRRSGIYSKQMRAIWDKVGAPAIYECTSVDEVGKYGHLDDCEFQVLIDRDVDRYYLVALTVDPERLRARVEDTEFTDNDIVEDDESPKPPTVIYFVEISVEQYRLWQKYDREKRLDFIKRSGSVDNSV